MRIIDADELEKTMYSVADLSGSESIHVDVIADIIGNAPTVDAVPVVRKPVEGYEGYYEVDQFGRVYSLDRIIHVSDNGREYDKPLKGGQMKQHMHSEGYKTVVLTKNGKSENVYVHRLVARAFINNPEGLPFINHKDEDKTNNFVENLEWCTSEYNINYGTGNERRARKIRGKVSPHAVHIEAFGECHTRKEWGNMYGITPNAIKCRMKRGWSAEKAISTPLMKNQYTFEQKDGDNHD